MCVDKKYTNIASSNADAHKCKFDCDVLAPTAIAVVNRLFPVSVDRHCPASDKEAVVSNGHEWDCI